METTTKELGLTENHDLSLTEKEGFLHSQIDESRKIIYRHLVELEIAAAISDRAKDEKDEELGGRLQSLAQSRRLEAREAIKQVKITLDVSQKLLDELEEA